MKICVISARYMISGVALAQHRFARALASAGHQVDFIIGKIDEGLEVAASPGVTVRELKVAKARGMIVPFWRYLRKEKPDIVFSAEDHLNTLVILTAIAARSRARISGSSRVTPFDTYSDRWFSKRWALKHLARLSFYRADVLSCVSKEMVGQYREIFGPAAPHVPIYNIVDDSTSRQRMSEQLDEPWLENKTVPVILAAGTLAPWKGFTDLIRAMALVRVPSRLIILGEGFLRPELEALVESSGLASRVKLPGFTTNVLKYFAHADVFVLSSIVEGLPNVLVEAMMCGCTPVATNCPTGPNEVLDGGRFGTLVPVGDVEALARAIEHAIEHPVEPTLLAEAVKPFEESAVLAAHFAELGLGVSQ